MAQILKKPLQIEHFIPFLFHPAHRNTENQGSFLGPDKVRADQRVSWSYSVLFQNNTYLPVIIATIGFPSLQTSQTVSYPRLSHITDATGAQEDWEVKSKARCREEKRASLARCYKQRFTHFPLLQVTQSGWILPTPTFPAAFVFCLPSDFSWSLSNKLHGWFLESGWCLHICISQPSVELFSMNLSGYSWTWEAHGDPAVEKTENYYFFFFLPWVIVKGRLLSPTSCLKHPIS